MSIIRVTLTSWRDLASTGPSVGGEAGDHLTGTVQIEPTLAEGWVIDQAGRLHLADPKSYPIEALPWSVVLVDPTECLRPSSGWGYRIRLCPRGGTPALVDLTTATITATPAADGVRTIDLADHATLAIRTGFSN